MAKTAITERSMTNQDSIVISFAFYVVRIASYILRISDVKVKRDAK